MSNQQSDIQQTNDSHETSDSEETSKTPPIEIDNRANYHQISRIMLLNAKRSIDIHAFKLEPEIVSHQSVIDALKQLPLHSSNAKIRILIQESRETVTECAAFVEMARKYSSMVEFRRLTDLTETTPASWMTIDQEKYITRTNYHSYHGKAGRQDKLTVRKLTAIFDEQWEKSEPDPELRQITI